jgi:hypothetical protein
MLHNHIPDQTAFRGRASSLVLARRFVPIFFSHYRFASRRSRIHAEPLESGEAGSVEDVVGAVGVVAVDDGGRELVGADLVACVPLFLLWLGHFWGLVGSLAMGLCLFVCGRWYIRRGIDIGSILLVYLSCLCLLLFIYSVTTILLPETSVVALGLMQPGVHVARSLACYLAGVDWMCTIQDSIVWVGITNHIGDVRSSYVQPRHVYKHVHVHVYWNILDNTKRLGCTGQKKGR